MREREREGRGEWKNAYLTAELKLADQACTLDHYNNRENIKIARSGGNSTELTVFYAHRRQLLLCFITLCIFFFFIISTSRINNKHCSYWKTPLVPYNCAHLAHDKGKTTLYMLRTYEFESTSSDFRSAVRPCVSRA